MLVSAQTRRVCGLDDEKNMVCLQPDKPAIFDVQQLDPEGKTLALGTNGQFCGEDPSRNAVVCNKAQPQAFQYQKIGRGRLTLRSNNSNLHCVETGAGVACDQTAAPPFTFYQLGGLPSASRSWRPADPPAAPTSAPDFVWPPVPPPTAPSARTSPGSDSFVPSPIPTSRTARTTTEPERESAIDRFFNLLFGRR